MNNINVVFVSVWKLVFNLKGRAQNECVGEHGSDEVLGPEREEVTGGERKLHNGTNSSRIQREKHVTWKFEMTNSYQILYVKPEWRRSQSRRAPSRKDAYLIHLAEYRVH